MSHLNFETLDYLKDGNDRQKNAYAVLNQAEIFKKLQAFNPLLVGTIPIAIDIETSDLDIVCCCRDQKAFSEYLKDSFGHFSSFRIWQNLEMKATLAGFNAGNFQIEIFGQ